VSQFNPFQYAASGYFSFSNDASLLLPAHVLTGSYVGASYAPYSRRIRYIGEDPEYVRLPGYLALVGISEGETRVTVRTRGHLAADADGRWAATPPGGTVTLTLHRGEVAQLAAAVPPPCDETRPGFVEHMNESPTWFDGACREVDYDLTGSSIEADRPISVFGAHTCADVPFDVRACDHLEEQLQPLQTLGLAYESAPLREPGRDEPNLLRVIAATDGTTVTIEPPQRGIATLTLDAGEYGELIVDDAIQIEGDHPIEVVQLMIGQQWSPIESRADRGDPDMTTLVPREQHRSSYVFATPSSYRPVVNGQSYLLITRPIGLALLLDEVAVDTAWATVGDREVGVVAVPGGTHRISGAEAFGVIVYGVGSYTSYSYPAGLDLRLLVY
jgi:hypothetical protein